MIIYEPQVFVVLASIFILLLVSVYVHFVKKNATIALLGLLFIGFITRLFMAYIDPFLHNWDERFHALVAKNMMQYPFKPMMRLDPIMPYKIEDWCCNHIWVHKQPLFLWQMAASMQMFGISEFVMRLPSILMGTLSIYFIYQIALKWIKNIDVAFVSAVLFAVSYYHLELTSGRFSLDQNDLTFVFYVTASIWAFIMYLDATNKLKWAILTGVFVGCAVLNKWLPGILIYGGWGLYLIMDGSTRVDYQKWKYLLISALISVLVFLPWQIYILSQFPIESAIMYEHNQRHIWEVLEDHNGTVWYHINQMRMIYGQLLLIFIPLGLYALMNIKKIDKKISFVFLAMCLVIFAFFSIIVKTKMPAFTYPVSSIIWIIIAMGAVYIIQYFSKTYYTYAMASVTILMGIYTLKPWQIASERSLTNIERNHKIENTRIYKSLDIQDALKDRVVINCKSFEDVELMFYKAVNAYHWYPTEKILDSLLLEGHKFAAFKSHNDQHLPEYIYNNSEIIIIDEQIK